MRNSHTGKSGSQASQYVATDSLSAALTTAIKYSALLCSTLLISESGFDGVFERFSSGFAVEFSSELERSEILCEAIF